jgi:hypothetical protein
MANFSGASRLKGKSRETLNIVVSKKPVFFFNFYLWGLLHPVCTSPPPGFGAFLGLARKETPLHSFANTRQQG